jgi:hypothetical protein
MDKDSDAAFFLLRSMPTCSAVAKSLEQLRRRGRVLTSGHHPAHAPPIAAPGGSLATTLKGASLAPLGPDRLRIASAGYRALMGVLADRLRWARYRCPREPPPGSTSGASP